MRRIGKRQQRRRASPSLSAFLHELDQVVSPFALVCIVIALHNPRPAPGVVMSVIPACVDVWHHVARSSE